MTESRASKWSMMRVSTEAHDVLRLLAEEQGVPVSTVIEVLILSFTEKIDKQVDRLLGNVKPKPSTDPDYVSVPKGSSFGKPLPANEVRRQRLEHEHPGDVD